MLILLSTLPYKFRLGDYLYLHKHTIRNIFLREVSLVSQKIELKN